MTGDVIDYENSTSMDGFFPSSQLSSKCRSKLVNDLVHGHVELEEHLVNVIDTRHFQRLRGCKQLGMCDRVFPGATHTRFEHSIGVAHLSGRQMSHLFDKQRRELFAGEEDFSYRRRIVELAGLCHDLGHGPLGHIFDMTFLPRAMGHSVCSATREAQHENRSVMMLNHLVDQYHVDMEKAEIQSVGELILGRGSHFADDPYMYQIVANEKNSVDVDKFDYIQRDTRNVNVKWGFDSDRLIRSTRVIAGEMCYHAREVYSIYDMFTTRFKLHKVVYNHRVVKAIELMAVDALLAADNVLKISESISSPRDFLRMSDSLLYVIEVSDDPKLAEARKILDRLQRRQLYSFVDEVLLPSHVAHISEEDISTCQPDGGMLRPTDLAVYIIRANHGMGPRNPVQNVEFYRTVEDVESFRIRSEQICYVMPDVFEERMVRVFCRTHGMEEVVKAAFRRYLQRAGIQRTTETSRKRSHGTQ
eukprot:Plantae.Rhodophyta-Purpureofilum_apyrenoidigerum.ctg6646.p1 GENE.Plantae.Rhodophyta-Purpureofilum_apyrenoidigerum.ctg6646~~Plantae.Rhodophyta-Purpureofilum_apyrenoidigerum.ctg6646.p1  ORF type:complete len:474 (-),score=72.29 Plantae.Rhodophyta-Purpureofilum_apyrenoidigerum.ctg6646:444-1865(-)